MVKQKTQNPILVIATLGVYFGLILAGATPQVLANAALTRQFDVKDEIELKDDLDTKPDDERSPVTASVQIYVEDVEYFLSTLARIGKAGKFDVRRDNFSVAQNTLLPCVDANRAARFTPLRFDTSNDASRTALEYFSRGMVYGYSLGDCTPTHEFDTTAAESKFNFDLDRRAFAVNVAVKKQSQVRAIDLARQIESTLALFSARANTSIRKAVLRNTLITARNDQVFVVTRLPRAGLVSLLSA